MVLIEIHAGVRGDALKGGVVIVVCGLYGGVHRRLIPACETAPGISREQDLQVVVLGNLPVDIRDHVLDGAVIVPCVIGKECMAHKGRRVDFGMAFRCRVRRVCVI